MLIAGPSKIFCCLSLLVHNNILLISLFYITKLCACAS
uniref:Uncharacterized protein n=1 Tax=Arundo donax TaxID=35708 RepID=A0A0A9HNR9_ARUDO